MRFSRIAYSVLCAASSALAACEEVTAPEVLVYSDRPIVVPATAKGWAAVTVGGGHACGIRTDGKLYCWGSNTNGQLGVGVSRGSCGRRSTPCEGGPRAVANSNRFITVSAGQRHTCGITTDRALYCWGDNTSFQTGVEREVAVTTPTAVLPDFRFIDVGAGATHTCAVRTNGVVYCWGEGTLGALGNGTTQTSVIPAPISSTLHFVVVRSGRLATCAITTDGAPWCWGAEWESAQGGFDFFHSRTTPHRIDGLPALRDITVSSTSICALSQAGEGFCWQANGFAQLGTGTLEGSLLPASVATSEQFTSISAGIIQGCGLANDGRALCWGNNSFGQLGVPRPGQHCGEANLECSRTPIGVFGGQRFVSLATGLGNHTCGVTVESAMLCWGLGNEGQLGDGFTRDRQSLPVGVLAPVP